MLKIVVPETELWDEVNSEFISVKEQTLQLEHSLVSLSKWESSWQKPFLTKEIKSFEETTDYIRCMTLTQNVNPDVYRCITDDLIEVVNNYIENPMTATWFSEYKNSNKVNKEQTTSELIYYWMITLNIPFECQKWHLNRLLTLIRVCNVKNEKPKKKSKGEIMSRNAALNAARKKQLNTKG